MSESVTILAAAVAGAVGALAVVAGLRWWAQRATRGPRRSSGEWCATCGRELPEGKVWELWSVTEHAQGFSGTSAAYCRRHAPEGSVRGGVLPR